MLRAVFLDRDGVINRAIVRQGRPYPPGNLAALEVLEGVNEALCRLRAAGFRLIVVTNQPDVARGTQQRVIVETMHEYLRATLPLDDLRVCYHDDCDNCRCRKPKPGLILDAAASHRIDTLRSYMVGDRWLDIEAGRRVGCATVFVDRGYNERRPLRPDKIVASLTEAAEWILAGGPAGRT